MAKGYLERASGKIHNAELAQLGTALFQELKLINTLYFSSTCSKKQSPKHTQQLVSTRDYYSSYDCKSAMNMECLMGLREA